MTTPDRHPGPLEEDEEIQLVENTTGPTQAGAFNFDGTDFKFRDDIGIFNPRAKIFDDLTGLAAYDTVDDFDGMECFVLTVKDTWRIDRNSTSTPDGITIIAAKDGVGTSGNWIRRNQSNLEWVLQNTWYIDPSSGDDENSGSASDEAVKTWAEFSRRTTGIEWKQSTTVTFLSDVPESDSVYGNFIIDKDIVLTLKGQRTSTHSGTTDSWTQNFSSNDPGTLTEAGWTPVPGSLLAFTSGPASGGTCWVLNNLGSNNAYLTQPVTISSGTSSLPSAVTPTAGGGDTFSTYTLTKVPITSITTTSSSSYTGDSAKGLTVLDVDVSWMKETPTITSSDDYTIRIKNVKGCASVSGGVFLENFFAQDTGSKTSTFASILLYSNISYPRWLYGGWLTKRPSLSYGNTAYVLGLIGYGAEFSLSIGSFLFVVTGFGVYNSSNSGIFVGTNATLFTYSDAILHGSGNTTYGIVCGTRSINSSIYVEGTPVITGTSGDIQAEGIGYSWSQVPFTDPSTGLVVRKKDIDFPQLGQLVVALPANLGTIETTQFSDGLESFVQTPRYTWRLDKSSVATPDGVLVVAAKTGAGTTGNWLRDPTYITEAQHQEFDTLTHSIDQDCYEEITRAGGVVTSVIVWDSDEKNTKTREETITREDGIITQIVIKQYNRSDETLLETLTEDYEYTDGNVSSITRTRVTP